MSLKTSLFYIFSISILLACGFSSFAEEKVLYKKVDKNGRVTFTDKPVPGSTKVVVNTNKNLMAIPRVKSNPKVADKDEKNEKEKAYQLIAIEQPSNDEAIRANDGNLYVIVALTPHLARNHSMRLLMDGSQVGQDQKVPYFSLTNIERGTHELTAQVIDDETGTVLQSSKSISFHILKSSRLQKNRR